MEAIEPHPQPLTELRPGRAMSIETIFCNGSPKGTIFFVHGIFYIRNITKYIQLWLIIFVIKIGSLIHLAFFALQYISEYYLWYLVIKFYFSLGGGGRRAQFHEQISMLKVEDQVLFTRGLIFWIFILFFFISYYSGILLLTICRDMVWAQNQTSGRPMHPQSS